MKKTLAKIMVLLVVLCSVGIVQYLRLQHDNSWSVFLFPIIVGIITLVFLESKYSKDF
jgi:putative effector of murein hydrolase LrgA (UPF0299 family)